MYTLEKIKELDITKLSENELSEIKKFLESEKSYYNNMQNKFKEITNAGYGAIGNTSFRFYKRELSESCTLFGQYYIKEIGQFISKNIIKFYNIWQNEKNLNLPINNENDIIKQYTKKLNGVTEYPECVFWRYSDTDSFGSSTRIMTDKFGELNAEELYNKTDIKNEYKDGCLLGEFKDEVKTNSLNLKTKEIEKKKIKYVYKHKINKKCFKITIDNEETIITEDESIYVMRNNEIISISMKDIQKGDKLIKIIIKNYKLVDSFKVEDIGIQNIDVYDVEVEDNHNLFGNDILLHNSIFIDFDWLPLEIQGNYNLLLDCINSIKDKVNLEFIRLAKLHNCEKQTMQMEMEIISTGSLFLSKKRYMMNIKIDGDKILSEPKLKIRGVEIVKSSTPKVVRNKLRESVYLILNKDRDGLKKLINDFEIEFDKYDIEEISFPRSVNNIEKYIDPKFLFKKGTPIHVRGSIIFNNYIDIKNLKDNFKLNSGDKIKFCYLTLPNKFNSNVISFKIIPEEMKKYINQYIDRKMMFKKTFKDTLDAFTKSLGWDLSGQNTLF